MPVGRGATERPEGTEAGAARLVGTEEGDIVSAVSELLTDESAYAAMAHAENLTARATRLPES